MKKIRKAVIPAAGFGTRFLPATKATPKEMLPIVDKPTIQYIVEEALASGIEEILIISGHAKRAIEDHFDTTPGLEQHLEQSGKEDLLKLVRDISEINIHYIRQKHMRGLGDAVLCARSFIDNEPFAVLLGDDVVYNREKPALQQMIDVFNDVNATVLGCQEVAPERVSSYGIVAGPQVSGEIQLTDALKEVAHREPVYAYCFKGKRYDVGNKLGFLQATVEYALRDEELGGDFYEYLRDIVTHKVNREK